MQQQYLSTRWPNSLYISRAMSYLYEAEFDILAGLGLIGGTENSAIYLNYILKSVS